MHDAFPMEKKNIVCQVGEKDHKKSKMPFPTFPLMVLQHHHLHNEVTAFGLPAVFRHLAALLASN